VVEEWDYVEISFVGKLNGEVFEGGSSTANVGMIVNDHDSGYIPGFASGIIGTKIGETVNVPVTFPTDYNEALAGKENEIAELNDKYLRLYAEYDNFRRRSAKEREAIYFDAKSDAVKNILPILDNMERATAFTEADKILEGMNLILKSFNENLSKMDVKEIEALGKTFDPNIHYAVMHVEDEAYGESEVVEVLQKGYICGDKVIRYAMVKVAN
jgi:molecular chaperone GrpE